MKKLIAMLLAVLMVVALCGCGASEAKVDELATAVADLEASVNALAGAEAAEAEAAPAELSGEVVLYSTMTENDLDALIGCFNEVYPDIYVEVVNGSAGELTARLRAEAENPVGDLVWGGMADSDGDANADIFEAWVSKYDAENMEGYTTPNGLYSMDHLSTVVFCVNTELEAELGLNITSYQDLLDPALQGQITTADPNSSSSAWNNLSNIMAAFGTDSEEAWAYIEQLMPNLVMLGSSSQVFKQVQQGEYVVGMTYEDGAVQLLKDGAENIKLVYPEEGTSASAFGTALVKGGPNPDNAKAFIDFICSAEGQTALAAAQEGTLRYTNANYETPENAWLAPASDITWVVRDVEYMTANKADILEHWNELWSNAGGTDLTEE